MKARSISFAAICMAALLTFAACGETKTAPQEPSKPAATPQAPAEASAVTVTGTFESFSSTDLEGNAVTEEIFSNADVTVVNFWGTFCPPCIGEMPELGTWAKEMPENVQLIGIVMDVEKAGTQTYENALKIVKTTGADYTNILIADQFQTITADMQFVPTTMFVDSQGNILGDPIVGADVEGYKERVKEILNGK